VSVTVAEARQRTFSILGAVGAAGQYAILQSDFRVLDALVLARDVSTSVDTAYVIRQLTEEPENVKPNTPTTPTATPPAGGGTGTPGGTTAPGGGSDTLAPRTQDNLPSMSPRSQANFSGVTTVALLQTAGTGVGTAGGEAAQLPPPPPPLPTPGGPGGTGAAGGGFQFAAPHAPAQTRVIRIPLDALKNGDLRYNIVIRPRDLILVPNPTIGEYYMGGHVQRVGVYSLTGRKITLKQAIVSAGMLDGVAIPQRTDIIRRIGPDREVFARLNLDAIYSGTQPDIYLKPYDEVMVGTNFLAPFIAAIRGGFRITYGFGFLYDRNYAPSQSTG
jgi:protein involved in polysaccharide export with SLBB domain